VKWERAAIRNHIVGTQGGRIGVRRLDRASPAHTGVDTRGLGRHPRAGQAQGQREETKTGEIFHGRLLSRRLFIIGAKRRVFC
jgi:hypothetical protein